MTTHLILAAVLVAATPLAAQAPALIPMPSEVEWTGEVFRLPDTVTISLEPATARMVEIASILGEALAEHGIASRRAAPGGDPADIQFVFNSPEPDNEMYMVSVGRRGALIAARAEAGALWGVQTLRQLIDGEGEAASIPGVRIADMPRFGWRGSMLDVGRHLFPVEYILSHLEWMSRHKLNVFHWHLTEDQGWRLAIEALPKLTEVGAWRTEADGSRYGGFYSKDDVRRVVERARQLGITVVPEIEMPGHARAALAAYPELGCTGETFPVPHTWGVFADVMCPGKEWTFTFIETVLGEVLELFPSRYIHIGGDEVPTRRWEECAPCQEIIRREGLGDEHGLQRWMIGRVARWLDGQGRRLIGWDEILNGGLPSGATVQAWQGSQRIRDALDAGADVIASPAEWVYLNGAASGLPMERVRGFDPAALAAGASGPGRLLGGEAPLWTEHVTSPANAELMWWPRLLAFAEAIWHGPADTASFVARAAQVVDRMSAAGVAVGPTDRALVSLKFRFDSASSSIRVEGGGSAPGVELVLTADGVPPRVVHDGDPLPGAGTWQLSARWQGQTVGEMRTIMVADHLAAGRPVVLATPADPRYPGTGAHTLVDGARGTAFNDGFWNGWLGPDLDASVDLGAVRPVHEVGLSLLEQVNSWILYPEVLELYQSADGRSWQLVERRTKQRPVVADAASRELVTFAVPAGFIARWLRVVAKGGRRLPTWHSGAGELAWVFADEIVIR
jgi:hexosaminidase